MPGERAQIRGADEWPLPVHEKMPSRAAIRRGGLSVLPRVHLPPIVCCDLVIYEGPLWCPRRDPPGTLILGPASRLDAFSASPCSGRGYPAAAWAGRPAHQRSSRSGPLVLEATPRTPPAPATDRDRTVSRRSEPSSRAAFMGEQPNPWDRLQPQDATSRHRGAKPCRRCELLGKISLLSPG